MARAAKPYIMLNNGRPSGPVIFDGEPPVAATNDDAPARDETPATSNATVAHETPAKPVLNLIEVADNLEGASMRMHGLARLVHDMIGNGKHGEPAPTHEEQFGIFLLLEDQAKAVLDHSARLRLGRTDALRAIAELAR